jgi:hypothetical protein
MITWTANPVSGYDGRPGTAKTPMFTISWRITSGDPGWRLRTSLPGMTRLESKNDDRAVLERTAERWLLIFAQRIGYAEEVQS